MCGFYIHGTTLGVKTGRFKHYCDPMEVNAHREFPVLTHIQNLDPNFLAHLVDPQMRAGVISDARRKGIALVSEVLNLHPEDICVTEGPLVDCRGGLHIRVEPYRYDWGIRPWDGNLTFQRRCLGVSPHDERLMLMPACESIGKQDFFFKSKQEFIAWTKKHWGRLGDGDEWIDDAPLCLSYRKLKPNLPSSFTSERIDSGDSERVYLATGRAEIRSAIQGAADPKERFIRMFKEAPNEFWACRN